MAVSVEDTRAHTTTVDGVPTLEVEATLRNETNGTIFAGGEFIVADGQMAVAMADFDVSIPRGGTRRVVHAFEFPGEDGQPTYDVLVDVHEPEELLEDVGRATIPLPGPSPGGDGGVSGSTIIGAGLLVFVVLALLAIAS